MYPRSKPVLSPLRAVGRLLLPALLPLLIASPARAQKPDDDGDLEVPAKPAARPAPAARRAPPAPPAPAKAPPPAPPAGAPGEAAPVVAPPVTQAAHQALADELAAMKAKMTALEGRLTSSEAQVRAIPPPPPPPPPLTAATFASIPGLPFVLTTSARPDSGFVLDPVGIVASGYLQTQYFGSQLSQDQLQQGGAPLNRDGFSLRLARVRLDGSWTWARFAVELSGNTTAGNYFGVLRAEASFIWRHKDPGRVPYLMVTGGLQEIPFGYELYESTRRRPFMERSLGSLALFPGSTNLGVRISGGASFVRYGLAVMNANPLIERANAPYQVETRTPEIVGRLGFDTETPKRRFNVAGGVSFLASKGFHAGTPTTVGSTQWRDANQNSVIDIGEIQAVPGRAATPSLTYTRWALNVDVQVRFQTRIGWTQIYGEATLGSNLDRGLFLSDPIVAGYDQRQITSYLAFTQEILKYGLVGFRWDYYDPNADFADSRRGQLVPTNTSLQTFSPVLGLIVNPNLRLLFQYDAIIDKQARDTRGVPVDLANDQWTLRLQGDF